MHSHPIFYPDRMENAPSRSFHVIMPESFLGGKSFLIFLFVTTAELGAIFFLLAISKRHFLGSHHARFLFSGNLMLPIRNNSNKSVIRLRRKILWFSEYRRIQEKLCGLIRLAMKGLTSFREALNKTNIEMQQNVHRASYPIS